MGYNTVRLTAASTRDVAFDAAQRRVFLSTSSGNVDAYDTATGAKLTSWHVADGLGAISVSEDGSFLLASDSRQPLIYKISTATGAVLATIVGQGSAYTDVEITDADTAIATGARPVTIDLRTNSQTALTTTTYYSGNAVLTEDRHLTLGGETGISNGPLFLYDDRTHSVVARGDSYQSSNSGFNYGVQAVSEAAGTVLQFIYYSSVNVYDLNLKYQRTVNLGQNIAGLAFDQSGTHVYALLSSFGSSTGARLVDYDAKTFSTLATYDLGSLGGTASNSVHYGNNLLVSSDGASFVITDPETGAVTLLAIGASRDGTAAGDQLAGTIADDTLRGLGGDDTITGGLGNDRIDGGNGFDTAVFGYNLGQATTITRTGAHALAITGPEGTDTLLNVEALRFANGTVNLDDADPLVDNLYYLRRYADVLASGDNPATHYAQFGAREGRDPNAFFSTAGYLAANPDVARSGANPLAQYLQTGSSEGRDPSAAFDGQLYLLHNPDVARAGLNPLAHYLDYGRYEGRAAYAAIGSAIAENGFDAEYYLLRNPDVAASGLTAYGHYMRFGAAEGRNPNAWFDDAGYLKANPDVAASGINPLQHFHDFGWREGRDPSAAFDTKAYLAANPDVAAAHVDPLVHFLQYGAYELRDPHGDGVLNGQANVIG